MSDSNGKLVLVPTPIGNLGDMTARGLDELRAASIVACEDTRVSGQLLKHYDIRKKLISYHDFNERERATQLIEKVKQGETVVVLSDAGSPGISDPAYRVVRKAIDEGCTVMALPGASAIIPALTASGLPTDRFFFEGFLSPKSAARRKRLQCIRELPHTLVFYESVHRIEKCLADMLDILGDRSACVAREISKMYEEFLRGQLSDICAALSERKRKGEFVVVVAGYSEHKKKVKAATRNAL